MRRVALVTAHFPPSNLVGVHRARIWAQYLPEYGWSPTIVTAHWKHYQEQLDWSLLQLVPDDIRVIRTKAFGIRWSKLLGNMALRALWWTKRELDCMAERNELDFVHIIVPDHYSALVGRLLYRSHGVAYGIDYMDPWVHALPSEKRFLSKAWVSSALSYSLEPWSVKFVRLITGVTASSYEEVLNRNPKLRGEVRTAEIPMASASSDYRAVPDSYQPESCLFDPDDGSLHIVYAGAIPATFDDSLECFLSALRKIIDQNVLGKNVRVWLIGTGTMSHGSSSGRVKKAVDAMSLSNHVSEYPSRIGYLDALWHLKAASVVLILGSTEKHYTPSKIYQAVHSANPILALVPEDGSAAEVLRSSGNGLVVNYPDDRLTVIEGIRGALSAIVSGRCGSRRTDIEDRESCMARAAVCRLANSLDLVCHR